MPAQVMRPTQNGVPPTAEMRQEILDAVRQYVADSNLVPPAPLSELREHSEKIIDQGGFDRKFIEYAAILANNAMWHDKLASVPYDRRLLLLPKCLRKEDTCPAPFDEFGLLCKSCGQCSLQDLQEEAERLGYAVLIAEGSAIVMAMIGTGKIDAIVGVSCLSVLEKAFPYMESAAIPGVAIPLLQDDCADTNVDMNWLWDVIHLTGDDRTYRLDLDAMREDVSTWFEPDALDALMGPADDPASKIARQWLGAEGKRWRPFLTACSWRAMQDDTDAPITESVQKLAIAVECFHKASLIHDDIEDGDDQRYEKPTVHADHGIPIALNVGDLLIGEGYRLIAEAGLTAPQAAEAFSVAAVGHRDLSLGQGTELDWLANPKPLKAAQVLEVFRRKTAPAFEVALRLGAIAADADASVHEVLEAYSRNLGIAYQIRDDMDDWLGGGDGQTDLEAHRLSVIAALAIEKTRGDDRKLIEDAWLGRETVETQRIHNVIANAGITTSAAELLDAYKDEAIRSLRTLEHASLKGLLRRVMTKIFNDLQIKGWCGEFEAAHAAGGQARGDSAA
jgi:geranylgeranyl diphosphate synthase type II